MYPDRRTPRRLVKLPYHGGALSGCESAHFGGLHERGAARLGACPALSAAQASAPRQCCMQLVGSRGTVGANARQVAEHHRSTRGHINTDNRAYCFAKYTLAIIRLVISNAMSIRAALGARAFARLSNQSRQHVLAAARFARPVSVSVGQRPSSNLTPESQQSYVTHGEELDPHMVRSFCSNYQRQSRLTKNLRPATLSTLYPRSAPFATPMATGGILKNEETLESPFTKTTISSVSSQRNHTLTSQLAGEQCS